MENFVSIPYFISFCWFNKIAKKGYQKPLVMDDLWLLAKQDKSETNVKKFEKVWEPYIAG